MKSKIVFQNNQVGVLEVKHKTPQIKNSINGFNAKLHSAEKN